MVYEQTYSVQRPKNIQNQLSINGCIVHGFKRTHQLFVYGSLSSHTVRLLPAVLKQCDTFTSKAAAISVPRVETVTDKVSLRCEHGEVFLGYQLS
jgi:hypothetical protein